MGTIQETLNSLGGGFESVADHLLDEDPSILEVDRWYHARLSADRELMRAIADVARLKTYRSHGFNTVEDWVSSHLGIGHTRACEYARVAQALERFPLLDEAYRQSRLSYDHLRALVLVATPANEADLVRRAEHMSVGATFRMVRKILLVDPATARMRRSDRRLDMYWDEESGMLVLYGALPYELGSKVERAIDRVARSLPDDPSIEGRTPMEVKRADALVALADSTLAEEASKPTIVVHVDAETLSSGEGNAQIEDGPTISATDARRMLCDALVQKVVYDQNGMMLRVDKAVRTAPRWMKRMLKYRDTTCAFGGCRNRKLLEAHHIDEYANGGSTEYGNLVMLCPIHHDFVHRNGYVVTGAPPKIRIERPGKPPIRPGPPPLRE